MLIRNQNGFSMFEILIILAIIGILSAIAIPSYNDSTRKTRRSEGKTFLMKVAQLQERHYTKHGRYATSLGTIDPDDEDAPSAAEALNLTNLSSPNGYYTISLADGASATAFTLRAAPQGGQGVDPCGTLTITNTGLTGVTSAQNSAADCW